MICIDGVWRRRGSRKWPGVRGGKGSAAAARRVSEISEIARLWDQRVAGTCDARREHVHVRYVRGGVLVRQKQQGEPFVRRVARAEGGCTYLTNRQPLEDVCGHAGLMVGGQITEKAGGQGHNRVVMGSGRTRRGWMQYGHKHFINANRGRQRPRRCRFGDEHRGGVREGEGARRDFCWASELPRYLAA